MKKCRKNKRNRYSNVATTTSKDWGLGPVPCKGGKTTNHEIQESMFQREMREQKKG